MPSDLQDGQITSRSGPQAAHANLSARQAKEKGLMMSGTYGPPSTGSLASAALQSSLVSKLRAKMGLNGSIWYRLTWKLKTTPSHRLIWQLRASGHRTSGKGNTGWPTPTVKSCPQDTLNPTPGQTGGLTLPGAARLAGWATPVEADKTGSHGGGQRASLRTDSASTRGQTMTLSGAAMECTGPLNPALPRWLMGYPPEWCESAVTAMQSFPSSRRGSSKQ